jgi:hypothetical protein
MASAGWATRAVVLLYGLVCVRAAAAGLSRSAQSPVCSGVCGHRDNFQRVRLGSGHGRQGRASAGRAAARRGARTGRAGQAEGVEASSVVSNTLFLRAQPQFSAVEMELQAIRQFEVVRHEVSACVPVSVLTPHAAGCVCGPAGATVRAGGHLVLFLQWQQGVRHGVGAQFGSRRRRRSAAFTFPPAARCWPTAPQRRSSCSTRRTSLSARTLRRVAAYPHRERSSTCSTGEARGRLAARPRALQRTMDFEYSLARPLTAALAGSTYAPHHACWRQ